MQRPLVVPEQAPPREIEAQAIERLQHPVRRPRPLRHAGGVAHRRLHAGASGPFVLHQVAHHIGQRVDVGHGPIEPHAVLHEAGAVHAHKHSRDLVAIGGRRNAAPVDGHVVGRLHGDEVARGAIGPRVGAALPLTPALVVPLGRQLHGIPWLGARELRIAPARRDEAALRLMVGLHHHADPPGDARDDHRRAAAAVAAPTMPAAFWSVAARTGGRTSSRGTNLSALRDTPPPSSTRSGQKRWSMTSMTSLR